jgi:gag-polyprotein putative aspartyl protease
LILPGPIPYEQGFGPPAPICKIHISWNGEKEVVDALLDSGASRTVIPSRLIDILKLRQTGTGQAGGAFAKKQRRPRYQADVVVSLLNKEFPALTVYVQDEDFALIGRDVLNKQYLILDGPAETFSIT